MVQSIARRRGDGNERLADHIASLSNLKKRRLGLWKWIILEGDRYKKEKG
jgi:hypothetical protein